MIEFMDMVYGFGKNQSTLAKITWGQLTIISEKIDGGGLDYTVFEGALDYQVPE
jgi:hypothetical protein